MQHNLCECGHDRRVHEKFGQGCLGCDCQGYRKGRTYRDRKPRLSKLLKRLSRKFSMEK